MLNIVLTRAKKDSQKLAKDLSILGFNPIVEPFIKIICLKKIAQPKCDAMIVTSPKIFDFIDEIIKKTPVYCVGEKSAQIAKEKGYKNIFNANKDVDELEELIVKNLKKNSRIFYPRGIHTKKDVKSFLENKGYEVFEEILYKAEKTKKLSNDFEFLLKLNSIDIITFFSKRTAQSFLEKIINMNLTYVCKNIKAFVVSEPIKDELKKIKWQEIVVSDIPNQESLIAKLKTKVQNNE